MESPGRVLVDHEESPARVAALAAEGLGRPRGVALGPIRRESAGGLHRCGTRVRQQYVCPPDQEVVERGDLVKGYEFAKDQYVRVTDAELKALEGETSKIIDIAEFVPLDRVDPIYFEKTYYLGPDKGASARVKEGELELAVKLLGELAGDAFEPAKYADEYRQRGLDLVQGKVEGKEVLAPAAPAERGHVIDLMEALKSSLAKQAAQPKKPPAKMAGKRAEAAAKVEAAPARRAAKR